MIDEKAISERLRMKSMQKKADELRKKKIAVQEIDRRLKNNEKGTFVLTNEQKEEVQAYWNRYTDSDAQGWVEYYSGLYGKYDVRFLPDSVYYVDVDSFYNDRQAAKYMDNKCFYSLMFSQIKQPEVIAKKVNGFWLDEKFDNICMERIIRSCQEAGKVIIKPAIDFGGGNGIAIWDSQKDEVSRLEYIVKKTVIDTVIQVFLKQHDCMERLHKNSVNTVRTISFYYKNEIRILSSVVRIGVGESQIDNISAGGISVGICDDGTLKNVGFGKTGKCFLKHPDGAVFGECRIPCYEEICRHIKKMHKFLPYFRLVSWDFAVDCSGNPVLIEANLMNGELDFHQINNGPLFHELTDEVLREVYGKRGNHVKGY